MQLEIQGVIHTNAHLFVQEGFYQAKPGLMVAIMNHLSLKAGLNGWGEQARSESKSEIKQLHFRNTLITMHRCDLTYEERQMVLESHMFLKDKLDGKIKVQTVAGGNKQCTYIPK